MLPDPHPGYPGPTQRPITATSRRTRPRFGASSPPFWHAIRGPFHSTEVCADSGASVTVNGTTMLLLTATELSDPAGSPWERASARAFTLVNQLLATASSAERLYVTPAGGHDQWVAVFRPAMDAAAVASRLLAPSDLPHPAPSAMDGS